MGNPEAGVRIPADCDDGSESAASGSLAGPPPGGARSALGPHALFKGRGWVILRLSSDVLLLLLAIAAARFGAPAAQLGHDGEGLIWLFPPAVVALFALRRLYGPEFHVRLIDGLGHVIGATALAAIGLIALVAFFDPETQLAPLVARTWLFATLYLLGGRLLMAWAQRRARANRLISKPTLVVGAGVVGTQVERRLKAQPELGLEVVGYLDSDPPPPKMVPFRTAPVLGPPSDLAPVVQATGAEHLVLSFTSSPDRLLTPLVREAEVLGVEVSLVPRLFESVNVRVAIEYIGGLPLLGLRSVDPKGYQFAIKHALDRVLSALLLLLLSPVMLALAVAVRLSSPGPIFFRQRRTGRDGRDFNMLKFRSMKMGDPAVTSSGPVASDEPLAPGGVEGDDRRTRVGNVIRRTSLDELPQLINVLRGQMSLVGPRPERPEFVELFGDMMHRYEDRHRVRSGITGWAQVSGLRGKTSLADRVEWDNHYIENWSLSLDFKILLMTVATLFYRAE